MKPTPQTAGCLPKNFDRDSLLTVEQFAKWRQIEESTARSQIAAGDVPVIQHSRNDIRIHPNTYLNSKTKGK